MVEILPSVTYRRLPGRLRFRVTAQAKKPNSARNREWRTPHSMYSLCGCISLEWDGFEFSSEARSRGLEISMSHQHLAIECRFSHAT